MFNRSPRRSAAKRFVLVVLSIVLLANIVAFGGVPGSFLLDKAAELLGIRESSATDGDAPSAILAAGDIAISGYIGNASPTQPDEFSFVLLTAVPAGTVLKFTDAGWRSDTNSFNTGLSTESEVTFTTGQAFPAGTEILFDGTAATVAGGGSAGTIVYTTGATFLSPLNFSSSGDELFIYQGTLASPTFITGIHMNVETLANGGPNNTDAANWDGVIPSGSAFINGTTSSKPTALTTGTNAIWIGTTLDVNSERDNARFACGPNVSTAALARAALNNQANWTTNNTNPPGFTLPTGCSYVAATPTATNTPTNTPTNTATNTPTNTATNTATNTPTPTPTVPPSISGTITYGNAIGAPTPRFVSNVTLSAAGSPPIFGLSGFPSGGYSLSGFGAGSYAVTPTKTTGQNGITSFDAALVALHVAGPPNPQLTATQLSVADVSGNNQVTSFDAGMIAKFVAGPPFTSPGIGSTSTWRFTPVSRTYASVPSSVSGEDYTAFLMGEISGNWSNTGARPINLINDLQRDILVAMPQITTTKDKEFIIPVQVQNAADKGIVAYEFDLKFDPAVIQPQVNATEMTCTASRGLSAVFNANEPGVLRVVVYGPTAIDSEGVLLYLRFTAVGGSGSISPLTLEKMMFNEGSYQTTTTDGLVEIDW